MISKDFGLRWANAFHLHKWNLTYILNQLGDFITDEIEKMVAIPFSNIQKIGIGYDGDPCKISYMPLGLSYRFLFRYLFRS